MYVYYACMSIHICMNITDIYVCMYVYVCTYVAVQLVPTRAGREQLENPPSKGWTRRHQHNTLLSKYTIKHFLLFYNTISSLIILLTIHYYAILHSGIRSAEISFAKMTATVKSAARGANASTMRHI